MQNVLIVIHLIITVLLIATVLMQRSEGGALGIGGGGGGGGNLFSSRGAGNALTRATAILATLFFISSIGLAVLATRSGGGSIFQSITPTQQTAPAPANQSPPGGSLLPNLGGSNQPAPVQPPANP